MEERLSPSDADAAKPMLPPAPAAHITEAERPPPSDTDASLPPPPEAAQTKVPLPLPPGRAAHETYVVQIPRDNVCRVPPPDHARIVEEHIRKAALKPERTHRRRRFRCSLALPIILIVVVAAIAILTARETLFRPTPPAFTVTRIHGDNLNVTAPAKNASSAARRLPEFRVTMRVVNRNPWMSINYGGGGAAWLTFKDKRIGQGKIPVYIKERDDGGADFTVVLAGKGLAALPKDMKNKLNGDQEKFMELTLDLTVEMRSMLRNEEMKLEIFCDLKVRNSLMKNAKISSQSCGLGL